MGFYSAYEEDMMDLSFRAWSLGFKVLAPQRAVRVKGF